MQTKLKVFTLILCVISCSRISTDEYFNFPVREVSLPEPDEMLTPVIIAENLSGFYNFWIDDGYIWAELKSSNEGILLAAELETGKEIGWYGKKGRGPNDFLSPVSFEVNGGHMLIFDVMNARVSDIDLRASIDDGSAVFSSIDTLNKGDYAYLTLMSVHKWNNSFLALDTGADPSTPDLYRAPDYVMYDIWTGQRTKEYALFKSIPLRSSKKELKRVEVKSRLYSEDCLIPNDKGICFVMKYIPQINFFSPQSGTARGFRIKELSDKSLIPGFLHYNSVSAFGNYVYALYVGASVDDANSAQATTELHVFDFEGHFVHRYPLDGAYIDVRTDTSGLYLSGLEGIGEKFVYRINWDSID